MPRRLPLRFYVEITVEHVDGPIMSTDGLEELVGGVIRDAVGVGEVFVGDRGSTYEVSEARLAPLDAATARRLG